MLMCPPPRLPLPHTRLPQILATLPSAKVIVTSQEPLHLQSVASPPLTEAPAAAAGKQKAAPPPPPTRAHLEPQIEHLYLAALPEPAAVALVQDLVSACLHACLRGGVEGGGGRVCV